MADTAAWLPAVVKSVSLAQMGISSASERLNRNIVSLLFHILLYEYRTSALFLVDNLPRSRQATIAAPFTMSGIPIPSGRSRSGPSAPISIPSAARAIKGRSGTASNDELSMSVPAAPLIGSLRAPAALERGIEDLSLPESSPAAFSLVRPANTERLSAGQCVPSIGRCCCDAEDSNCACTLRSRGSAFGLFLHLLVFIVMLVPLLPAPFC